ncbi:uncharacterized protein N7459_004593 [Penicillium hispanicum]|uniref:uncharacterized protein n=1 Tax=Penicillium hispanicum TaxID=1080232 RepID=UPI00254240D4|nr:uncharacterized protein N7459_004593 [Penicillium hispanicum]KAJ5584793.1 hypothetical protein N7459_004593 [Penicillium hispanicum]
MAEETIAVDPDVYSAEVPGTYPDDWQSETTSIGSSIYRGLMENGRRYVSSHTGRNLELTIARRSYQTLSNKESLSQADDRVPSDDQMFETYEAGHLVTLVLEAERENPLFRSPIKNPKQILDIGTGKGTWAIDVADMFPEATVRGVDLFPPPVSWMPPNCVLEVDNILQDWTWREQFDLIHMRLMIGSFDPSEWDQVYKQCYDKLRPGGWIEQVEASPFIQCDDNSLPPDNVLNTWGPNVRSCGERAGRSLDTVDTMSEAIRKAGFVDMNEKTYKWPIGPWPRDQKYKEAGTVNFQHWISGMEGWSMWLLTKFGSPEPWTKEEVLVYVARLRAQLKDPRFHIYERARRVWARKPFPDEVPTKIKTEE